MFSKRIWSVSIAREYRVNRQIRASTVRVITEDGDQVGVLSLRDALVAADERGLDLVEVAPTADPPVCRLLDYGRFRYIQTKRDKESRKSQKTTELREIRFKPTTGQHDIDSKSRTIKKLLLEGSKVKVSVLFRGRSITHPELGIGLLRKVAESMQDGSKLEKAPSMEGRMLSIILAPLTKRDGVPTVKSDSESELENEPVSELKNEPVNEPVSELENELENEPVSEPEKEPTEAGTG